MAEHMSQFLHNIDVLFVHGDVWGYAHIEVRRHQTKLQQKEPHKAPAKPASHRLKLNSYKVKVQHGCPNQ